MFKSLSSLVKACDSIKLTIQIDPEKPDGLMVVVSPNHMHAEKYPALAQPLLIKGTPAVLDTVFASTLEKFTPAFVETTSSIDASIEALAAAKEAAAAAKNAPKKVAGKPLPKPEPSKGTGASSIPPTGDLFKGIDAAPNAGSAAASDAEPDGEADDDDLDGEGNASASPAGSGGFPSL